MYLDDPTLMLAAVIGWVADDGRVSLLVRNGLAPAMRAGLRGDWAEANAAFGHQLRALVSRRTGGRPGRWSG